MNTRSSGSPARPAVFPPHFEQSASDAMILIECDCPIGEDHTYADWLARFTRAGF